MVNGKVYIGKTSHSLEQRWIKHQQNAAGRYKDKSYPLYNAINKYGIENFQIEVVEDNISDNDINNKEKFYIKQFNSCILEPNSNGYNATYGGDGNKIKDYNEQIIIQQYQSGKSAAEIGRLNNISRNTVCEVLNAHNIIILSPKERGAKKVQQLDKNTEEILQEYSSITDASKSLGKGKSGYTHISRAARGIRKTAYGYKWKIIDE